MAFIIFPALGDGECILPPEHVVNPLKLQDSISYDDIDVFQSVISTPPTLYNHTNHVRTRRDTEKVVNTRTIIDKDGHRRQVVSMVGVYIKKYNLKLFIQNYYNFTLL